MPKSLKDLSEGPVSGPANIGAFTIGIVLWGNDVPVWVYGDCNNVIILRTSDDLPTDPPSAACGHGRGACWRIGAGTAIALLLLRIFPVFGVQHVGCWVHGKLQQVGRWVQDDCCGDSLRYILV